MFVTEGSIEHQLIMKDAIRCCLSCILPCGALDAIRIVHATGRVEEITGASVTADDVMRTYPNHVLKKPTSPPLAADGFGRDVGSVPRKAAVMLPPDAKLQRGKIYFLVRVPSPTLTAPEKPRGADAGATRQRRKKTKKKKQNKKKEFAQEIRSINIGGEDVDVSATRSRTGRQFLDARVLDERYLSEILSEKATTQRDRRRGRVGIWRPHLESISEVSGHV